MGRCLVPTLLWSSKQGANHLCHTGLEALLLTDAPPIPNDMPEVLPAVNFMLPIGVFPVDPPEHSVYSLQVCRGEPGRVRGDTGAWRRGFRVNAFCTDLEGIATMFGSKADGYGVELFNKLVAGFRPTRRY